MKKILLLILMLSLFQNFSFSQDQHQVDSLLLQLKNYNAKKAELQMQSSSLYDTTAVTILFWLSHAYWESNPDKATGYANQSLALSETINYKKGMAMAYNSLGVINWYQGNFAQGLEAHNKSLKIREEIGDKEGIATALMNIGIIYNDQGNYAEALKKYFAALKIIEEFGNKKNIATTYGNIGIVHWYLGNYGQAIKYYSASLKICEELGDKKGIAGALNNIGDIYKDKGDYSKAYRNYIQALQINKEIGNKNWEGINLFNIGCINSIQGNYSEALKNHFESLKTREELGDKDGITTSYINIGEIYLKEKKYSDATQYLDKALVMAKNIGSLNDMKDSYHILTKLDSAEGNYKQSLEHYKLFIEYRDSLVNNESTQKTVQLQMQFDFDKKQVADSLKFVQEKQIEEIKLQKQKAITYGGFAGIAITIILLFFVYRNYDKQRTANQKLKSAQEQLIRSEKMAAFGVMASRVSHEIQNPLNFVNNFSELSKEMVEDVIHSDNTDDRKQQGKLLISNLEKINEHGKRMAVIVKQLQEHSNKGTAHEFFEEN